MEKMEKNSIILGDLSQDENQDIIWRPDNDSILGGIYVRVEIPKFSIEKNLKNSFQLTLSTLFLVAQFTFSGPSPSIAKTFQQEKTQPFLKEEKGFLPQNSKEQALPKAGLKQSNSKKRIFDPFTQEVKEQIRQNAEFFEKELPEFGSLNQAQKNQNFLSGKKNYELNIRKFIFIGQLKKDHNFSFEEKNKLLRKFFVLIMWCKRHKVYIVAVFLLSVVLIVYYFFKNNKILLQNSSTIPKNGSSETIYELDQNKDKFIENKTNNLIDSGIIVEENKFNENLISSLESDNTINEIDNTKNISKENPNQTEVEIIENLSNELEVSLLDKQKIESCIVNGNELKLQDKLLTKQFEKFEEIKNHFIKFGENEASTEDEWIEMARLIKKEFDSQIQKRIEWENNLEKFENDCL